MDNASAGILPQVLALTAVAIPPLVAGAFGGKRAAIAASLIEAPIVAAGVVYDVRALEDFRACMTLNGAANPACSPREQNTRWIAVGAFAATALASYAAWRMYTAPSGR